MADVVHLARSFLNAVGQQSVVTTVVLMFVISRKQHCYADLLYALFLTVLYNAVLKCIFKCPLPETCPGTGYGFPSGHYNFGTVFYVWMILANRKLYVSVCLGILWLAYGWCLVVAGYHYALDICLTPLFSLACVWTFWYVRQQHCRRGSFVAPLLVLSTVCMVISFVIAGEMQHHITLAYCSICGLSLFSQIIKVYKNEKLGTATNALLAIGVATHWCLLIIYSDTIGRILQAAMVYVCCFVCCLCRGIVQRIMQKNDQDPTVLRGIC
ncbi:MAG: hypothetical protein LBF56_01795 [Holosporales bacterium]|jgi:hypothetical protein|nr:hypothetical protein [Holosporales bacterium]